MVRYAIAIALLILILVMLGANQSVLRTPIDGDLGTEPTKAPVGGDPNAGALLFEELGCSACHSIQPGLKSFGPNLARVAQRLSDAQLQLAIDRPSAEIAPGYQRSAVVTVEGRVYEGYIRSRTLPMDVVVLETEEQSEIRIPCEDIEELTQLTSDMPEGLADGIAPEDYANLMAFLKQL